MTEFKNLLSQHRKNLFDANAVVTREGTTLFLRFDSRDTIAAATYEGAPDIWMASLCEILKDMPLAEARLVSFSHWELLWKNDQFFWDMKLELGDRIFFPALELLHAAIDVYRGREDLYHEESALICRCFGVREKDVLNFLKTAKDITLEELSKATKAGMGCRSCVPQLRQWLKIPGEEKLRFYLSRPVADWILDIDNALVRFPLSKEWKMNVESMKGNVVLVSYDFPASQKEEEEVTKKLQGFLSEASDPGLAFFLRRSRQR
jgi:bacterioferritin-associated ferredoxin